LWGVPGLKDLNKESKSEGQKKAKTSGERRPMAGAAMLAHFKEQLRARFRFPYTVLQTKVIYILKHPQIIKDLVLSILC
jgi:hypothetical protein